MLEILGGKAVEVDGHNLKFSSPKCFNSKCNSWLNDIDTSCQLCRYG